MFLDQVFNRALTKDCVVWIFAVVNYSTFGLQKKRLCIPHRTLWRYTNVVLLLLLLQRHAWENTTALSRVFAGKTVGVGIISAG